MRIYTHLQQRCHLVKYFAYEEVSFLPSRHEDSSTIVEEACGPVYILNSSIVFIWLRIGLAQAELLALYRR